MTRRAILQGTPLLTPANPPPSVAVPTGQWLSFAPVDQDPDPAPRFASAMHNAAVFGGWRHRPIQGITDWHDDTPNSSQNEWNLEPGGKFESWWGHMECAPGGLYQPKSYGYTNPDSGLTESWPDAATGGGATGASIWARWQAMWNMYLAQWTRIQRGTLFVRPFHELNGDWYPWSVFKGDEANFRAAMHKMRLMRDATMPAARLVFSVNRNSTRDVLITNLVSTDGNGHAVDFDVYGVDYYNNFGETDAAGFNAALTATSAVTGGTNPLGLEAHRLLALQLGVPIVLSEWGSHGSVGDYAGWYDGLFAYLSAHAGSGPGQFLYESLFNVPSFASGEYSVWPSTLQPRAAARYRAQW